MSSDWFFKQEILWRTIASGIWTFIFSFGIFGGFLLIWIFSPFHHVINICNYFFLLIHVPSWLVISCIAILFSFYVRIFTRCHSVTYSLERIRLQILAKYFNFGNIFLSIFSGIICFLISCFVTHFSTSHYSMFAECHNNLGTFRCLNETYFIFLMFGLFTGFAYFLFAKINHHFTIKFPIELQGRILSVKVNLSSYILSSGKQALFYTKYFLIAYYLLGIIPRYIISTTLEHPFCEDKLIGFNNLAGMISVTWSMWIFGTMLLLLINISWHLFNSYLTKMYPFPVDSVFPEDEERLLTNNLDKSQHPLIQHLAFQYLSFIANYSTFKRQQLFLLKYDQSRKPMVKWEIVADECLKRISELTQNLKNYHQSLSGNSTIASKPAVTPHTPLSNPSLTSALRRRPLAETTNTSQANISYFEFSPSKETKPPNISTELRSSLLNNSITVPTPKLWTRNQKKTNLDLQSRINEDAHAQMVAGSTKSRPSVLKRVAGNLKKLPFIAFFVKEIPDRAIANIFSDHNIYKWSIESISLLSARSLTEDKYGFALQKLPDIVSALVDLLFVLEKHNKVHVPPSSPLSALLSRQHQCLRVETRTAIYRITNAFSKHMNNDIPVKIEHQRRLKTFLEQKE